MASSRKKPSKVKPSPKVAVPVVDHEAELRELREQLKLQRQRVEDDADDDDDDDDEDDNAAIYDPRTQGVYVLATHSALPTEMCNALAQGEKSLRDLVAATSNANARNQENLFTGFATNAGLVTESLRDAQAYGIAQRTRGDQLQEDLNKKNLDIANMIRASEDAALERQRLAAELDRGRQALHRLELELEAKSRDKQAELNAVVKASAPVFAVAASGVQSLLTQYGAKAVNSVLPAAADSDAPPQASPQPRESEAQVSCAGTDEWRVMVGDMLRDLKSPEPIACLRAMLFSYALPQFGAPPLPSVVTKELLFNLVEKDLGRDRVVALLQTSRTAYVAESEVPA